MSVTVAHTIFTVALLVGGGALGGAIVRSHEAVAEGRHADMERRDATVHTSFTIDAATWDGATKTQVFTMTNDGSTVLDVRQIDVVVDGAWETDEITSWTVDDATTNWWSPQTTLNLTLVYDVGGQPRDVLMCVEYGVCVAWRR